MSRSKGFFGLCIDHPVGTILLFIGLLLCGLIAFNRLPLAPLPEADAPTIQIYAFLPGGSAETMASAVAAPLETQLAAIPGVKDISSESALGSVVVSLEFDLSKNIDVAGQEVQAAINAAAGSLPADLPDPPVWKKLNPADRPILIFSVTSDTLSDAEISDYAETAISRQLSLVKGVGDVRREGLRRPAVRIQARPELLAAAGVTFADVRAALTNASANRPKGAVVGDHRVANIKSNGQLYAADDYADVVVAYKNGAPVRVKDVARVSNGVENDYLMAMPNGKRGVNIILRRQPGSNIVETVEAVMAKLPEIKKGLPADLHLDVLDDHTGTIRASLHETEMTLIIASLLVIAIMALFLRQWSVTLVVFAVLAVSVVATSAALFVFGLSLNNLSLVAIIVAIGFIVDDVIVVVENIHRHLEMGKSKAQAALDGVQEIGFTVVSISLSLVAVFIPVFFMSGYVGRLFREFAISAGSAVLISVAVCLTLAPTLCALIVDQSEQPEEPSGLMTWVMARYEAALTWCLDHVLITFLGFLACVAVSVLSFVLMPKGFFPEQDTGFLSGTPQASADISFSAMHQKIQQMNAILAADPDVISFSSDVGDEGTYATGALSVTLSPPGSRKASANQIIERLERQFDQIPDLDVTLRVQQDITIGSQESRAQYQYVLRSSSLEQLAKWTPRLTEALEKNPLFRDVNNDLLFDASDLPVTIDRAAAARYGFSAADVDNALYDAFGQRQVNNFQTDTNQYQIILELSKDQRQQAKTLELFKLRSPVSGELVPLSAFAHVQPQRVAPVFINHSGLLPSANLSFNLAPGASLGNAVTAVQETEEEIGMPGDVMGSFHGAAQAFQDSLASQPWLILAALVAIYIILGVLYESLAHPLTILSTIPSAGIGAFLFLWLWGMDFTLMALVGLLLLIGIVKKNGILLVDFALVAQREEGLTAREAIHKAALIRFRPILMTTLAAIFGAVPLMVGFGTGSELRQPLGVSVVGGLLLSQLLTLLTTPVIYLLVDRYLVRHRPAVSEASAHA